MEAAAQRRREGKGKLRGGAALRRHVRPVSAIRLGHRVRPIPRRWRRQRSPRGNAEAVASDLRLPLPCTAAVSRDKAATLSVLLRVSSLLLLAVVAAAAHSHLASSIKNLTQTDLVTHGGLPQDSGRRTAGHGAGEEEVGGGDDCGTTCGLSSLSVLCVALGVWALCRAGGEPAAVVWALSSATCGALAGWVGVLAGIGALAASSA
uniref:Uncharacterized protein n=2 Tax=Oryza sativa subsp. japonica TaxID=39947 RepID=Q2R9U2_ORYSJ|nr:hypothetical protein LOC_Os11g07570 [Oryza sativa Japonica Group]ABA91722.1 hypothetical protein LOC_Os11g07570 [Oryza sativa Japonica Group]